MHVWNFPISSPIFFAMFSRSSVLTLSHFFCSSSPYISLANSLYFHCDVAQSAASASSGAFLCILRGYMRYSRPILPVSAYSEKSWPPMTSWNCMQAGHWKSVNTVIWTFDSLFPKNGLSIFLSRNELGSLVRMSDSEEQEASRSQDNRTIANVEIFRIIKSVLGNGSNASIKNDETRKKTCRLNGMTSSFLS